MSRNSLYLPTFEVRVYVINAIACSFQNRNEKFFNFADNKNGVKPD